MLLTVEPDEEYCLKSQLHEPVRNGNHLVCYRCGMLMGEAETPDLGTLLDY